MSVAPPNFPRPLPTTATAREMFQVDGVAIPLEYRRRPQARRYILRLSPQGVATVTVPGGGSARAAREFVVRQQAWLLDQWHRVQTAALAPLPPAGVYFRGERVPAVVETPGRLRLGDLLVQVPESAPAAEVRRHLRRALQRLAVRELPARVAELATPLGITFSRVTIRDQRSRWGSCSAGGTISLNWRLIQMPPLVRDYIILHELVHRRELNHSDRYWTLLRTACPTTDAAEAWLRQHTAGLREL